MAGRSLKIKSYRAFSNLFELAHEFQKWEDDPATADLALNALQRYCCLCQTQISSEDVIAVASLSLAVLDL